MYWVVRLCSSSRSSKKTYEAHFPNSCLPNHLQIGLQGCSRLNEYSIFSALPTVELDNVSSSMTISRDQLGQFTLTCNASNYNADKPVVWVKDGIYFGNGVAPNGLRLTIGDVYMTSQLDVYRTSIQGLLQGYYRCEVWGFRTDRISSPDTLVTFEGSYWIIILINIDKIFNFIKYQT